jgi:small conductance mechanosensitive channel
MFETRSESWREAGLAHEITPAAAKRARREGLILLALFAGIVALYDYRAELTGPRTHAETLIKVVTVIALLIVGWAIARDFGRGLGPVLLRRMEPATAGTMGFVVRLGTLVAALIVALSVVGLEPAELVGVAGVTAVILGLAAQQPLGNFFAGTVLISARPFRVGDRVRLQGGMLAGQIEGVVSSQGLLYTTFAVGEDSVLVPNSVVLGVAVRPVREPDSVSLRARLAPGMNPAELQELLEGTLRTPLRGSPQITLEELDAGQAVVRIAAIPRLATDGRHLAGELLAVVSKEATGRESARPESSQAGAAGEAALDGREREKAGEAAFDGPPRDGPAHERAEDDATAREGAASSG